MKISAARDHRGFSLVELLIAVTMLGIIAAPLLHAFVTSAQIARKSYDMGELTLAAQTAAELVEADNMASIAAKAQKNGGTYVYTIPNVDGRDRFDARITLDPAKYSSVNSVEITQYSPMDAVFSQTGGGADPDAEGMDKLLALAAGYEGGALNTAAISRAISIDIVENGVNYTYSCRFSYSGSVSYKDGDRTVSVPVSCAVEYPSFYAGVKGATENSLSPLYFFFMPRSGTGSYDDQITVRHTTSSGTGAITPVSVFLAAQKSSLTTYTLLVALRDLGVTNMNNTTTRIYSNVAQGRYSYHVYVSQSWYQRSSLDGSLVETSSMDRMFDVTIEICARGDTGKILYTLSSGKLD